MENENKDYTTNKEMEEDLYAIDTAKIFMNELSLARDPDYRSWKKCPKELGHHLEHLILDLLVKNVEPTVDYSPEMREYLIDKFNKFNKVYFGQEPFHFDFFVTAYIEPRSDENKRLFFGGTNYYYMYNFDHQLIISREKVTDEEFELLFAFALRQCDIMQVDQFLDYHLHQNFNGRFGIFGKYIKQVSRKYPDLLFSEGLTESIKDWLEQNEKAEQKSKKIKTFLTVEQLAYLFRALKENYHLGDERGMKQTIIDGICETFTSKQMDHISTNSFDQDYSTPTLKAIEFWIDNFEKLKMLSIRMKQIREKE